MPPGYFSNLRFLGVSIFRFGIPSFEAKMSRKSTRLVLLAWNRMELPTGHELRNKLMTCRADFEALLDEFLFTNRSISVLVL